MPHRHFPVWHIQFNFNMITFIFGLFFFGCFLWYNRSKKVKFLNRPIWLDRIMTNNKTYHILIVSIIVVTLLCLTIIKGIAAGLFAWIVLVMGFLSLIVLIYPFQYMKSKSILMILSVCLLIEISFYFFSSTN